MNGQPIEESEMVTVEVQKPVTHILTFKSVPETLNEAEVTVTATNVAGEAKSTSKLSVSGQRPQFIQTPIKCTVLEGTISLSYFLQLFHIP